MDMGQSVSGILTRKMSYRVFMDGLDDSGKTTILYRWKLGSFVDAIHTIGFNVEEIEYKNYKLTMWDVGGGDKIRPLKRHYYPGVQVVIYVVDSCDRERIEETRYELHSRLLCDDMLRDAIFIILANKQDVPNAMSPVEVAEKLQLNSIKNHRWHIQATSATKGEGLNESLAWICNELEKLESNGPSWKPTHGEIS